ncbi:hypothetical protein [Streptomyces niveus]
MTALFARSAGELGFIAPECRPNMVGERQPFPDSPLFAVMLTELPLR